MVIEKVQRSESEDFQPINSQQRPTLEKYLLENYQRKSMKTLIEETGLTEPQLRYKAKKLGLKKSGICSFCGETARRMINDIWMCNQCYYNVRGSKCAECGSPIGERNYRCLSCSRNYVGDVNRTHEKTFCRYCGKKISYQKKTCGRKNCVEKYKIERGTLVEKYCANCGKRFTVSNYINKTKAAKFCSQECYKKGFFPNFSKNNTFKFLGCPMRSSWEVRIAQLLTESKIKWEYEGKKFGSYIPDFYLPDFDIFIEVKGFISKKSLDKIRNFRKQGYTLYLITEIVYNKLKSSEDMIQFLSRT